MAASSLSAQSRGYGARKGDRAIPGSACSKEIPEEPWPSVCHQKWIALPWQHDSLLRGIRWGRSCQRRKDPIVLKATQNPADLNGTSTRTQGRWEESQSWASMLSTKPFLFSWFVKPILFAFLLFLMQILLFLFQLNGVRTWNGMFY